MAITLGLSVVVFVAAAAKLARVMYWRGFARGCYVALVDREATERRTKRVVLQHATPSEQVRSRWN